MGAENHPEAIEQHLSLLYKEEEMKVFHEIVSPDFHLDVYIINSEESDFNLLLTSGMSSKEMKMDEKIKQRDQLKFAELMLVLPKSIIFDAVPTSESKNAWILSMLKQTARFPHEYETWVGQGHSIQASADMAPYHPDCKFVAVILLPSVTFEESFTKIHHQENLINLYSLFPLYENELNYKIEHGYNAFLDLLIDQNVDEVFDLNRKNLLS